jgi:hypothetical protein
MAFTAGWPPHTPRRHEVEHYGSVPVVYAFQHGEVSHEVVTSGAVPEERRGASQSQRWAT